MHIDNVLDLIKSKRWYHIFEIVPGIFSDGKVKVYPKQTLDAYGVPAVLTGKKVLDIGAWDGPYSFELEARGATVTAVDIQDPDSTGFNAAKRLKGSSVRYVQASVYDLPGDLTGQFDIVLFLGVYYHLRNPILSFQNIWHVLAPDGRLFFEGAILDHADRVDPTWKSDEGLLRDISSKPLVLFTREEYCQDRSNWSVPTQLCLHEWLRSTGFSVVNSGVNVDASRGWGEAVKNGDFAMVEHDLISPKRPLRFSEWSFFWRRSVRWIKRKLTLLHIVSVFLITILIFQTITRLSVVIG